MRLSHSKLFCRAFVTAGIFFFGGLLPVNAQTFYHDWKARFSWKNFCDDAPDADPDRDGIINLQEYAFGGTPFFSDPEILPSIYLDENRQAAFKFFRNREFADIAYVPEISDDLKNWRPISTTRISFSSIEAGEWEECIIKADPFAKSQFFRVRVNYSGTGDFIDSDNDGVPDYYEILWGGNPNDGTDADSDPDRSGFTLSERYRALSTTGQDIGDEDNFISKKTDAAPFYAIADLGGVEDWEYPMISEKNGWVVTDAGRLWHAGVWTELELPEIDKHSVTGIADVGSDGTVIPYSYSDDTQFCPTGFYWTASGAITPISASSSYSGPFEPVDPLNPVGWFAQGTPRAWGLKILESGNVLYSTLEVVLSKGENQKDGMFWGWHHLMIGPLGSVSTLGVYEHMPWEQLLDLGKDYWSPFPYWVNRNGDLLYLGGKIVYAGNYPRKNDPDETYGIDLKCLSKERMAVGDSYFTHDKKLHSLPSHPTEDVGEAHLINSPLGDRRGFYTIASPTHVWFRKTDSETGKLTGNVEFENPISVKDATDIKSSWSKDYESWEISGINDNGFLVAAGYKEEQRHAALLIPGNFVQKIPGNSEAEEIGNWLTTEAFPVPEVKIESVNAEFVGTQLKINVRGTVIDRISEYVSNESEKLREIDIILTDKMTKTLDISGNVSEKGSFEGTIFVDSPGIKGISLKAETKPNASGLKGWARAALDIEKVPNADAFPIDCSNLSIAFTGTTPGGARCVSVYLDDREPAIGDGDATEDSAMPGLFRGTLSAPVDGEPEPLPCAVQMAAASGVSNSSLLVRVTYSLPDGRTNNVVGIWEKNEAGIFRSTGPLLGNEQYTVASTNILNTGPKEKFYPLTFKMEVIDGWENDPNIRIKSGQR